MTPPGIETRSPAYLIATVTPLPRELLSPCLDAPLYTSNARLLVACGTRQVGPRQADRPAPDPQRALRKWPNPGNVPAIIPHYPNTCTFSPPTETSNRSTSAETIFNHSFQWYIMVQFQ
jgi:hypothetical protein